MTKNKRYASYRKNTLRRRALIILVACFLLGGAWIGFAQWSGRNDSSLSDGTTINLDPPTETEKKEAEQNKDRLAEEQDNKAAPTPAPDGDNNGKKSVKPIITEASRTSVRAYIPGVFEDGGTCTATFTKSGQTLTKASAGFENVSYTQCAPITYESGYLSNGKWSVTVTYSSSAAHGTSDVSYIE